MGSDNQINLHHLDLGGSYSSEVLVIRNEEKWIKK